MLPVQISIPGQQPGALPGHYQGARWEGLTIGPITIDGAQPALPMVTCWINFKRQVASRVPGEGIAYSLRSDDVEGSGTIVITDAATWSASVPEQDLPLDPGIYDWDFKVQDTSSLSYFPVYYGTITITRSVS